MPSGPSQSDWCNTVLLVRKKDEQFMLLHQFLMSEHPYKEGFLPIAQNTRGTRKPSRCWSLFLPGSENWILADKDGQGVKGVRLPSP